VKIKKWQVDNTCHFFCVKIGKQMGKLGEIIDELAYVQSR